MTSPRLVIFGQLTIDDVVPPEEGRWHRRLGGNALYTLAGARLVMPEREIGVVSRLGTGAPAALADQLRRTHASVSLSESGAEQLVEWLVYEPDGSRRTMPRNAELRRGADVDTLKEHYLSRLEAQSPRLADMPADWHGAEAIHCATQVWPRHEEVLRDAPTDARLSLDPSRHYAATLEIGELATRLARADAVLPSEQEIGHLAPRGLGGDGAHQLATALLNAGLREVVVKLGARGCVVGWEGETYEVASRPVEPRDPTGAGDAFCGAYAAARLCGMPPAMAAERAVAAGARVVGCSGVDEALALAPTMRA